MGACRAFLQCLLKLFNFLLCLSGILLIVFGVFRLNEWKQGGSSSSSPPSSSPPSSSPPSSSPPSYPSPSSDYPPSPHHPRDPPGPDSAMLLMASSGVRPLLKVSSATAMAFSEDLQSGNKIALSGPWFLYFLLGVGGVIVLIALMGAIGAEVHNACCLSCYQFGLAVLLLVEGTIAAAIFFDKNWSKDLPEDPTGEMQQLKKFVRDNFQICLWGGVAILGVQVVALLLAMILRAMHASAQAHADDDDDHEYVSRPGGGARAPLLPKHHQHHAAGGASHPGRGRHVSVAADPDAPVRA